MVERLSCSTSNVLATTHLRSRDDLQTTIERNVKHHNGHLPQKALGHKTPMQAMWTWRQKQPDLLVGRVNNKAGLDKQP